MENIQAVIFRAGSKEELLPHFSPEFPYIATQAELDRYVGHYVPWHWHKAVELFYMESGVLEYYTPNGKLLFSAGSGGLVNCNVLHMTKVAVETAPNVQLLHIFDPSLLAGEQSSRIAQTYIAPIITASQIELLPLFPENPLQAEILQLILDAFHITSGFGYELRLRSALSEIWLRLFEQARPLLDDRKAHNRGQDKIKQMMVYIHEHYPERITIPALAASAFLSERECYREFHKCLHMTPTEYIKSYRLQMACQMLAQGKEPITAIGRACGLGSSSYFGQTFRDRIGCTPSEYRRKWQDRDN